MVHESISGSLTSFTCKSRNDYDWFRAKELDQVLTSARGGYCQHQSAGLFNPQRDELLKLTCQHMRFWEGTEVCLSRIECKLLAWLREEMGF